MGPSGTPQALPRDLRKRRTKTHALLEGPWRSAPRDGARVRLRPTGDRKEGRGAGAAEGAPGDAARGRSSAGLGREAGKWRAGSRSPGGAAARWGRETPRARGLRGPRRSVDHLPASSRWSGSGRQGPRPRSQRCWEGQGTRARRAGGPPAESGEYIGRFLSSGAWRNIPSSL